MDFSLLPSDAFFEERPLLASVAEPLRARLGSMPAVLERLDGAVWFAEKMLHSGAERAAVTFRAALAEMVSMEEVQTLDWPHRIPLKVRDSENPMIHMFALVRHLNIHVRSVRTKPRSVSARFGDQDFDMHVAIIDDLTAADISNLRNGKHYSLTDLTRAVDWFNLAQLHWGAGYLVRVSAEAYAVEIASHHGC